MKKIVLVALLAVAAGCGSKKTGSDCDAAIAKGIENFSKNVKEHAPNPQIVERMMGMMDKLKGVLTERCKADSWSPEVVSCFTTVNNRKDMQACQSKLSPEQASKLTTEITQVMMSSGGMGMGQRMPPGMAGHPDTLAGSGAGAAGGAAAAPGAPAGSPDPSAAGAAPSGTPAAPAAPAAPAGNATPPAGSDTPK
jgi:hypothetical protein